MKIKSKLIMIITMVVMCIPTQIYAWLQHSTYEVCNSINILISSIMRIIAVIIVIGYITVTIQYLKHSKTEERQKVKNALKWLVIVILEVVFFVSASIWVTNIGMEKYWTSGERYQFNDGDGLISMKIRVSALGSMIVYIISSIIYFIKSKDEQIKKIQNIVKWQVITSAVVGGLLILATKW